MTDWPVHDTTPQALLEVARKAQQRAYAPYSNFRVGAALVDDQGRIFTGCNVENASYGMTICAERNAVAGSIVQGGSKPLAIAIVGLPGEACTPCGACRQVLVEFNPDMLVVVEAKEGVQIFRAADLIPHAIPLQTILLEKE